MYLFDFAKQRKYFNSHLRFMTMMSRTVWQLGKFKRKWIIGQNLSCFRCRMFYLSRFDLTIWVSVATPTDRPKFVCNRCINRVVTFVLSLCFFSFLQCQAVCLKFEINLLEVSYIRFCVERGTEYLIFNGIGGHLQMCVLPKSLEPVEDMHNNDCVICSCVWGKRGSRYRILGRIYLNYFGVKDSVVVVSLSIHNGLHLLVMHRNCILGRCS